MQRSSNSDPFNGQSNSSQFEKSSFRLLDDLLIISETFDDHLLVLQIIPSQLRASNLTLNIEKSKFLQKEVHYLGYIVGGGTLRVNPDKVSAIADYPIPSSVRQVRRFLGMAGYYRRFINNFAAISAGITNVLKSPHSKFNWTSEANESFIKLKYALTSAPLLINPDYNKPFVLQCNASQDEVGCVLIQLDQEGQERPIAYMSKKLNSAQRNYSVTEQECLAALLGIKKFQSYIEGQEFKIITDHASLKWLMQQKELTGRLARWSLKLQGFSFIIEHRRGNLNIVPDALSRLHSNDEINELDVDIIGPELDILSPHFQSEAYIAKAKLILENDCCPDLRVVDGIFYKRIDFCTGDELQVNSAWKVLVPRELMESLICHAHNPPMSSHGGVAKTLERLKRNFYWPRMASQVRTYISQCEICKQIKAPNTTLRAPMVSPFKSERPFQRLYMDIIGPYPRSAKGNLAILIILDHVTKFHFLHPLRKLSSSSICSFVEEQVFHMFGVPEFVVTDNGYNFELICSKNC